MMLSVHRLDGFRHQNGPVVRLLDGFLLHLNCRNAGLIAGTVRGNVLPVVFQPGCHLVHLGAGERILNVVVAVASVDLVPLVGRKGLVVILPGKGHYYCVAAWERHCYVAERVGCQAVVALVHYCCVVALAHHYYCVAAWEHHYYVAERVSCQAVVARLQCYVAVLIAHYFRLVAGLQAVARSRDVVVVLHLYSVARLEVLSPVARLEVLSPVARLEALHFAA